MRTRILGGMLALITGCLMLAHTAQAIGPIVGITIAPTDPLVAAGTAQSFTVTGRDAAGVTADLTANTVFTTTDPLGTITANAYTAGKSGNWVVTGNYNDLTADAKVAVVPGTLDEIIINPNSSPERLAVGSSRSFTAEAFDANNNVIREAEFQWTTTDGIGTVSKVTATTTKLTATTVGEGTLVARIGETTASIKVAVTAAPVVTTNTNANANTNVNAVTNTNAGSNVNAAANTDTDISAPTEDSTNENVNTTAAEDTSSCKGWSRAAWVWLFIGYVILLVGGLYPIRKSRPSWWWAVPLVLTVAIIWLYYQFRCYPLFPAYPYLTLLAAITVMSWYNWQQPADTTLKRQ